ncbi:hypothetical protein B0H14DRAFT_2716762 [Mycena olivaceomarginata]|nr:hypothetical protein B0H14DRAFT_2716762 [Mycena olivaceomarginata]
MCMRFNSSVRPLVALLVFLLLYIRYTPAVLLSLRSTLVNREPRTELSLLIAPHSLVPSPTLRYAAGLVDTALS